MLCAICGKEINKKEPTVTGEIGKSHRICFQVTCYNTSERTIKEIDELKRKRIEKLAIKNGHKIVG